ncbi:2-keto-3-deoxygluconate permease [Arthrobacter sp. zg-Y859]|uniref:2-keto-3-deoxygluconate permease n=1 Tax=Arthrobacter jinronghuae TaxID=2964609 RepID=A0ABT1NUG6_9MICC|nr:2-keto-3-deoxygluconate permease [Arthrobacter jinronghuae]MCQ1950742.1 2-keto-3-deoxygluconate permease [Arthrobacter jinronghuae]UWX79214.1 2-keto-3-deoxygluconate permease [Arthrobacter jinronghuae]
MAAESLPKSRVPLFDGMNRIPGGLMLIPLILGSVVGTFFPAFLEMGSFTTALFADSALPLIAILIFATGMQITAKASGPVLATTGVVLLFKTIIPAALVAALGLMVGIDGILGISILALLASFDNSNGGLWLAFTGRYGDYRDRGAYMASAINDGPFFTLLFLGLSGLGNIPILILIAAIIPLALGFIVGNLDAKWTEVMRPVPNIVIPFFAFSLGTGIDLGAVLSGGIAGIFVGIAATLITGALVYLGYRFVLRRGAKSGVGIASATTAGNSIATPAIVAAADPAFAPYVDIATAQVASAVLVTAIFAPLLATWVLKRQGGLENPDPVPVAGEGRPGVEPAN